MAFLIIAVTMVPSEAGCKPSTQFVSQGTTNDDTNDYFGMEMLYATTESGLVDTAYFNGNISAMKWKGIGSIAGNDDRQSYKYKYDKSDRLLKATSNMYNGSAWTKEVNVNDEKNISYDDNGNIKTLQRNHRKHQLSGVVASYTSEAIDNLTYTYKTSNGNQLDKVEDATGKAEGFANGSSANGEFTYNADGSVGADNNKGIDTVYYNMLGKPWQVVFTDGRKLEYTYGASGEKLTMKFYQGTVLKKTTDYSSEFVYEDGILQFFGSPEGRVNMAREDRVAWEFTSDLQGWQSLYQVSNFAWNSSGYAQGTITGSDPHIASPAISVPIDKNTIVKIRMKVNSGGYVARLYFTTSAQGSFNESMAKPFTLVAQNDVFHEYTLDLSENSTWNGTLTKLRIDPVQTGGGNSFAIDYIKVIKRTPEYEYAIADHQGNTRIVFSSVTPDPYGPTATFENLAADTLEYRNIPSASPYWVTYTAANHTPGGGKVVRMNQNFSIGPAKSLKVYPGDKVDMEVWTYYENNSGFGTGSPTLSTLITAVASAFGGVGGAGGESGSIYNGVNQALNAFGVGGNQGDTRPGAYLNYILYDKNYKLLDMGWTVVPTSALNTKQQIFIPTVNIKLEGFIFVYLSYENQSNNYVAFDDFKVTYTKSNVLQYNEYYPFGLQTSNSWTRENASNRYLYNGGNELNENSGWYETFFRGYDAALGRFMQVDPLAPSFGSHSPYHFAYNNPVLFNDVLGDSAEAAGDFINRALNSAHGGTWSNGQGTLFSNDEEGFNAGADYVSQTNSWGNTYYGSYEATYVGHLILQLTGELLSPSSVHQAIQTVRNNSDNPLAINPNSITACTSCPGPVIWNSTQIDEMYNKVAADAKTTLKDIDDWFAEKEEVAQEIMTELWFEKVLPIVHPMLRWIDLIPTIYYEPDVLKPPPAISETNMAPKEPSND